MVLGSPNVFVALQVFSIGVSDSFAGILMVSVAARAVPEAVSLCRRGVVVNLVSLAPSSSSS